MCSAVGVAAWLAVMGLALGACTELDDGAVEETALEQDLQQTFALRSMSVPTQIIDPLVVQSGAFVRLGPANIVGQQKWVFDGLRLHHITQQQLCLQPETALNNARLILRPCETGADSLQQWAGLIVGPGQIALGNRVTDTYVDASAGAFGILRMAPRSKLPSQAFRME